MAATQRKDAAAPGILPSRRISPSMDKKARRALKLFFCSLYYQRDLAGRGALLDKVVRFGGIL